VYAGHWLKPAKQLVDRCGGALSARLVWLFSSGPIGDPPKPDEDPADVAEILAATGAREHRLFAGKLIRQQLSFPEKAIVSALRVPEGDFRDWPEITGWAAGIATALQSHARRCSRARVTARISATSAGSSSGLGGSPMGPLENSHTGRADRAPPQRSTSCLAGFSQRPAYTALPRTTAS
jgi:hypothetical protein